MLEAENNLRQDALKNLVGPHRVTVSGESEDQGEQIRHGQPRHHSADARRNEIHDIHSAPAFEHAHLPVRRFQNRNHLGSHHGLLELDPTEVWMSAVQIRDQAGCNSGSERVDILNQQGNIDGGENSVEVAPEVALAEREDARHGGRDRRRP